MGQRKKTNMKTYNKKNVFLIMVGILTMGAILNIFNQYSTKPVVGMQQDLFEQEYAKDLQYIESNPVEETILATAASISPQSILNHQRTENLRVFFEKRKSPLAQYAEEFVLAADYYGIDYRIVAAISIIESGGGKINFRPYNAWGWGSRGFDNWKDGIWSVTKGLAHGYYAKGLDTPEKIAKVYCPPSSANWARKVTSLMNQIGD